MEYKNFLIDYNVHLQLKNKLHFAVDERLKRINRSVVEADDVKQLWEWINQQVIECN